MHDSIPFFVVHAWNNLPLISKSAPTVLQFRLLIEMFGIKVRVAFFSFIFNLLGHFYILFNVNYIRFNVLFIYFFWYFYSVVFNQIHSKLNLNGRYFIGFLYLIMKVFHYSIVLYCNLLLASFNFIVFLWSSILNSPWHVGLSDHSPRHRRKITSPTFLLTYLKAVIL